jgi:hypothetical protein
MMSRAAKIAFVLLIVAVGSAELSVAEKRLAERHCRLGKIRWRPRVVRRVVRSQRPWMGTVLSQGKVDLVVSSGRAS